MAKNLLICEPNTSLPQKFVLDSTKSFSEAQDDVLQLQFTDAKKFPLEMFAEYKVLPLFHRPNEHFRYFLSINHNAYLRCKWHKFLEDLPSNYITIKLYRDAIAKKELKRKMTLNGHFYGIDNKLAPIPIMPDPRKYNVEPLNVARKKCSILKS